MPGSENAPRLLLAEGHPGTKAKNSGVWGSAPERARQLSSRAQPISLCRLRGIGYIVCLYTQVSYPAPLPRPAEH